MAKKSKTKKTKTKKSKTKKLKSKPQLKKKTTVPVPPQPSDVPKPDSITPITR